MKRTLFFFSILFVLFTACQSPEVPPPSSPDSANIIMPLGASRVQGARPAFESYRYELWKLLVSAGYDFDFIGTNRDAASYPDHEGQSFDRWHEGHGGYTSGQILTELGESLERTGAPDIVLLSSPGGNDGLNGLPYDEAVENVNAIVDLLQAENPNVTIIIEQIAPARTEAMTEELTTYLVAMQQEVISIADAKTTATSEVLTVDMFTDFGDQYLADDVHYNEAGAAFIAVRYYPVLESVLVVE